MASLGCGTDGGAEPPGETVLDLAPAAASTSALRAAGRADWSRHRVDMT
jgi:hypothetical protein